MKNTGKLLLIPLSVVILFCNQCGNPEFNQNNGQKNFHNDNSDSVIGIFTESSLQRQRTNRENYIKKISSTYNLPNLKEKKVPAVGLEIRIWGDLGLDYEKVLVINFTDNNEGAYFIEPMPNNPETDSESNLPKRKRKVIPKSGWENLKKYLIENNIKVPLPYSLDKLETEPIADEGLVLLEVKQGNNYNIVFFRQFTTSKDGKAVIDVCKNLQKEFNVKIGCG